jgi:hypothetical protein
LNEVVKLTVVDHCTAITIDARPVTALSASARLTIFESIKAADVDAAVKPSALLAHLAKEARSFATLDITMRKT